MHGVVVNIFLYASSMLQFLCNNMLDAIQSSGMVWLFLLWLLHSLFSCPSVRPLVMYEQTLPTTPFISNLEHTYLALHMLSVVMFALMWDPTPRVAVFNPFICLFGLHVCHSYIYTMRTEDALWDLFAYTVLWRKKFCYFYFRNKIPIFRLSSWQIFRSEQHGVMGSEETILRENTCFWQGQWF